MEYRRKKIHVEAIGQQECSLWLSFEKKKKIKSVYLKMKSSKKKKRERNFSNQIMKGGY
jgi:hypothetical protein